MIVCTSVLGRCQIFVQSVQADCNSDYALAFFRFELK